MLTGQKLGEALASAIQMKGVSKADVARAFGVKPPSVQGWLKNGRISKEHIEKLLTYFSDVVGPEHWGITTMTFLDIRGQFGSAEESGVGDQNDIPSFLRVDKRNLGPAIETPMRPVVVVETLDDIKHDIIEVPRYTLKASAGTGQPILEIDKEGTPNYCRAGWAKHNGYKSELLFSMRMTGISMQPTIPDGASLIVHRQQEIESGRIHIICRDGECFVKRLYKQMDGSLLIHSDNDQAYKDILLQPGDPIELHVVGLVVTVSTNV